MSDATSFCEEKHNRLDFTSIFLPTRRRPFPRLSCRSEAGGAGAAWIEERQRQPRVGLRGEAQADRPTEGRASKKSRLVALNGSTASSLGAGARAADADGASVFTTYGKYFQAIAAVAQTPTSTAPTGPINPALFFLLRTVIPTIASQDQTWRVFR